MRLKDLRSCIAAYNFDATGFNAGTQKLVDKTGWGHDMSIVGRTTPLYATRAGHQVTDFDNSYYYQVETDLFPPGGSFVIVGVVDLVNLGRSPALINTWKRKAAAGNFAGYPVDNAAAEFLGGGWRVRQNVWVGNVPRAFDNNGANVSGVAFTPGQMGLFSAAHDDTTRAYIAATNRQQAASSGTVDARMNAMRGFGTRIGHLFDSGGLDSNASVPNPYLSLKRAYFFSDNVFSDPRFQYARELEMGEWGVS